MQVCTGEINTAASLMIKSLYNWFCFQMLTVVKKFVSYFRVILFLITSQLNFFRETRVLISANKMKKKFIITGSIIAAFVILYVFNRLTSKSNTIDFFTEVQKGEFEIAVASTGELIPERSVDIKGPELAQGRDIRSTNIRIQDLVPEGTMVKEGDYIATLDRTELNNNLKDARELLLQLKTNFEMKLLDTAIVQTGFRDQIKNQGFTVEEAAMTLHNSKFEPPTVIRQAEIELDKSQRVLEQRQRSYTRRLAQNRTDIYNQNYWISRVSKRVKDLEEVLAGFTVTAPASGMVIYKKEWRGNKRKVGSTINPMDRVVATLPDLTSMISKTFINEIDVSKMKSGQVVNITIDAFPKKSFKGVVTYVANIGEKLPNTNDKVFEVQIKVDGYDRELRPSMTTGNKIIIQKFSDVVYLPIECVQAGVDSVPFVYNKNGTRQVVLLGATNEKHIIIEKGLEPGSQVYLNNPKNPEKFRLVGEELIPLLKEREKIRKTDNNTYRSNLQGML
jgi:HlyD family secretion protein